MSPVRCKNLLRMVGRRQGGGRSRSNFPRQHIALHDAELASANDEAKLRIMFFKSPSDLASSLNMPACLTPTAIAPIGNHLPARTQGRWLAPLPSKGPRWVGKVDSSATRRLPIRGAAPKANRHVIGNPIPLHPTAKRTPYLA